MDPTGYLTMIVNNVEQKLRDEARALLEQGRVDYIIGFEPGSLKFTTTPLITKDKDDTDRLVINPFITNNLSIFLTEITGKAGIVVKGCDSRSIVSLIQDNKVAREEVVILGIPCKGMIDLNKIERLTGRDRDELDEITPEGNVITVTVDGIRVEFRTSEVLYDNCLDCEYPTPQEYNMLLDKPVYSNNNKPAGRERIKVLKGMSLEQRWKFWKNEFSRCIKCYACRSICPACFCQRCFVEESEPQWVLPIPRWQENLIFQVVRNIHVAGRCTDCGECERSCPVNIPLRSLTREMYDIIDELFDYKAGMDKEAAPLMSSYELEEVEDLFR